MDTSSNIKDFGFSRTRNPVLLDLLKPVQDMLVNCAFDAINISTGILIRSSSAIEYKQQQNRLTPADNMHLSLWCLLGSLSETISGTAGLILSASNDGPLV